MLEKFPTLGAVCRLHTSSYRSIRNLSNGLTQIRRFNGGRLTGIRALLHAIPERIWYTDQDGFRHSCVAYILNLEVAATDIPELASSATEPIRLPESGHGGSRPRSRVQYLVRESEAERAAEIAAEFYPNSTPSREPRDPNDGTGDEEQCARICGLAGQLGYDEAKIKMKLGQWAGNLAGLERELLNELDSLPEPEPPDEDSRGAEAGPARREEEARAGNPADPPAPSPSNELRVLVDGFLF
jgi:hypothetical protein